MDINGLTLLNRITIILFGILGSLLTFAYYLQLSWIPYCRTLAIIWVLVIIFLFLLLYYKIVYSLDNGNYETAKTWILIGIFIGLIGGIIPFILFIISYIMFDDAIRTEHFGKRYYGYPQSVNQIKHCNNCRRQIPFDSNLCPYCGIQQIPMYPNHKTPSPPQK